jgi:hypothetical protein
MRLLWALPWYPDDLQDAKNAPGPLGAALVSRQEDWKAGRPLPQLSALPFNFGLFPLCSPATLLTCGVGANSAKG